MQRRNFVRVLGGSVVAAAGAATLGACSFSSQFPAAAVAVWQGPGSESEPRRRAIAYAITAPNPHNRQPWLVDLGKPEAITLYCDRTRLLPETDPFGRQILIGHGAFLELLVQALAQQGLASEVRLWPEGELPVRLADWDQRPVARIRLLAGGQPDPLFAQVLRRHTPKVDFDTGRPVAAASLQALLDARARSAASAGSPASTGAWQTSGTIDPQRVQPLRDLCWAAAKGRTADAAHRDGKRASDPCRAGRNPRPPRRHCHQRRRAAPGVGPGFV